VDRPPLAGGAEIRNPELSASGIMTFGLEIHPTLSKYHPAFIVHNNLQHLSCSLPNAFLRYVFTSRKATSGELFGTALAIIVTDFPTLQIPWRYQNILRFSMREGDSNITSHELIHKTDTGFCEGRRTGYSLS